MKKNQIQKNIPNGWERKKLSEIGKALIGLTYSPDNIVQSGGTLVFRSSNIKSGRINYSDQVRVSANISEKNFVKEGDILICARNGSRNLIGKNAYISKEDEGNVFGAFMTVFRSKNPKYIYQLFQSSLYKKEIERDLGPTINQVTTGNLSGFKFNFPPLPEQNRIVSVLETWDKAIEKLTKKIEFKKNIKKGLMQRLLTGEIRLSGFSDGWKVFRLGDISKMSSGGTPSSKVERYYNGGIPWVSIADMTKQGKYIVDTEKKLTKEGLQDSAAKIYPAGTILYAMYASIGECGIAVKEMTSSQAILGIEPDKNKLNNIYLYYFLTHLKDEIKLLGQQGTQANLNAGIVKDFKINLPIIEEQQNIIDVLQSSDNEIDLLESKLDKLKEQKNYLINNLITGAIRTPETMKIKS